MKAKRHKINAIDMIDIFGKPNTQILREMKERYQNSPTPRLKKAITHKKTIIEKEIIYNQIYERMEKFNLRSCVIIELWEQSIFFSIKQLNKMLRWNKEQFNNWFEDTI